MSVELPNAISTYFAGSNAHDADVCAACFTDDAIVLDEGRERRGVVDIRAWKEEVIEKYRAHVEVVGAATGKTPGESIVTGLVSGKFPGSPVRLRYSFILRDGKIVRLGIAP